MGDREVAESRLLELVHRGVLLSDSEDESARCYRQRSELLEKEQWHPHAAFYHFMTRGSDRQPVNEQPDYDVLESEAKERASRHVARHGPPPDLFFERGGLPVVELPPARRDGELYESLLNRKTVRNFDPTQEMSASDFSTILKYVFAWNGFAELSPSVKVLHRSSPSGGARHPIEVYPVILNTEGFKPGIYHYLAHRHSLEVIRLMPREELVPLVGDFANGQKYAGGAHALFILSAKYYRNYWKYRKISRTYSVVLMDVAHLSQTFYLVATDLNLGAFFSAAIHGPTVDEALGLDGYSEGAIAICGCGVKLPNGPDHSLLLRPIEELSE